MQDLRDLLLALLDLSFRVADFVLCRDDVCDVVIISAGHRFFQVSPSLLKPPIGFVKSFEPIIGHAKSRLRGFIHHGNIDRN
jgi:hypothetical protein